jgi:hypothetical protein
MSGGNRRLPFPHHHRSDADTLKRKFIGRLVKGYIS